MFGHEKFGAYQHSIQFASLATEIIERLPEGHAKLIDQLRRAAISISLNIAEGSGKNTESQKCHCYAIARGEAMECAAIMDILLCMRMLDPNSATKAKELLEKIVAILSSVCKKKRLQTNGDGI
jgi:four helix bundle protein